MHIKNIPFLHGLVFPSHELSYSRFINVERGCCRPFYCFYMVCFPKPRSGKRTTFLQGPGKVVMVAICM